ncbi:MAG: sigma-54-dependent Fis family transcriptional regulator [Kofleriaceae bacterium]
MADTDPGEPVIRARLVVVYPLELAWEIQLAADPVEIGREGTVRPLRHRTVSRRHVALRWARGTGHVITDLGSHNGSRVEGDKLGERGVVLEDNDVVQLGEVFLIYELVGTNQVAVTEAVPGQSDRAHELRGRLARAAPDRSPVLVLGETGTGKEWIARELHRQSKRSGALVSLNCAALSPQLVESQLFGHVRGAFTGATTSSDGLFEAADRGTLFLDEIGELAPDLQPKLLRVLQDHEVLAVGATRAVHVDVRVIAATNRDLAEAVEQGGFRRDLYARLAMWELEAPALRDRRVDLVGWLVRLHTAWGAARGRRQSLPALTPDAVEAILLASWPDNLRGLERLVHALVDAQATTIGRAELPGWLAKPVVRKSMHAAPMIPDRATFVAAFGELAGNVSALARKFGRDRRQIYRWIEAHGCG